MESEAFGPPLSGNRSAPTRGHRARETTAFNTADRRPRCRSSSPTEPPDRRGGILVGISGRPARLEVLDSERTRAAHWSGLLHAAALDALDRLAARTPAALARSLAERVQGARFSGGIPAELGRRFPGGGRVRVDDVRWHDRTVQLSAAPQEV